MQKYSLYRPTIKGVESSVPWKIFVLIESQMPLAYHVSLVAAIAQLFRQQNVVKWEAISLRRLDYAMNKTSVNLNN